MPDDPFAGVIGDAVAMLEIGPARKAACHDAAPAFRDEFDVAPRSLTVAVGTNDVGWCV